MVFYSICSKIMNTFLFLFSTKMFVLWTEIQEMLVGTASKLKEEPDHTALILSCLSGISGRQLVFEILEHLQY